MSATYSRVENVKQQIVAALRGITRENGYRNDVQAVYTVPVHENEATTFPYIILIFGRSITSVKPGNPGTAFNTKLRFIVTGAVRVDGLVEATSEHIQDAGETLLHDIHRVFGSLWYAHVADIDPIDESERLSWMITGNLEEDRHVMKDRNIGFVQVKGDILIDSQGPDF